MSQNTNNSDNQDIDLSMISKKITGFFDGISFSIFKHILFLKRNLITLVVLVVAGFGIGIYLDTTIKSYDSEIIVRPNFGSTDYLYSKIYLLESKIKENDTLFLKSIGIDKPKTLVLIEIEPVIDIYSFVNNSYNNSTQNSQNFELVKLLSEDGDIKKIIKDIILTIPRVVNPVKKLLAALAFCALVAPETGNDGNVIIVIKYNRPNTANNIVVKREMPKFCLI